MTKVFFNVLTKNSATLAFMIMAMFVSADVLAAAAGGADGGLASVGTFLTSLSDWLTASAAIVVTIALLWCGYIMMFSRGNIGQIPYIIGGGLVIGAAGTIAGWLTTG